MSKIKEIEKIQASIIEDLRINVDILQKELNELKANSPKYKIGQKVYVLEDKQIYKRTIESVSINKDIIQYFVVGSKPHWYCGEELFATIQDLLDDLASQEIKEL